jgi:hypothetical protein
VNCHQRLQQVTVDSVKPSKFSPLLDNIGYDWKAYAYAEYTVKQNYRYIIKSDDRYYKLRFWISTMHRAGRAILSFSMTSYYK